MHYQISRLFHRSLIKFLSGKLDIGVSIANKVAIFSNCNIVIDKTNYRNRIIDLLKNFKGDKAKVQEHAATMGESMNSFVVRAIDETMERDNQKQE